MKKEDKLTLIETMKEVQDTMDSRVPSKSREEVHFCSLCLKAREVCKHCDPNKLPQSARELLDEIEARFERYPWLKKQGTGKLLFLAYLELKALRKSANVMDSSIELPEDLLKALEKH